MSQYGSANYRIQTGTPHRLRLKLGTLRVKTNVCRRDLESDLEYTLKADDGSYEQSITLTRSEDGTTPEVLVFERTPMDRRYTLELASGDEAREVFTGVPFRRLGR